MKKSIILVIKGFIMGIANIIPGVSGGTLALTLGIYEDFINAIGHFTKDFKKNIKFLIPLGIGILLSLLSMSSVIKYSFLHYPLYTALFFTGLVAGGIPSIFKSAKPFDKQNRKFLNLLIFVLAFSLVIGMAFLDTMRPDTAGIKQQLNLGTSIEFILIGIVVAATMVLPGVSGSLLLMLLGHYDNIIFAISSLTKFENLFYNVVMLSLYGVGILVGLIGMARLVEYLFAKFRQKTLFGVLGFMFASVLSVPIVSLHNADFELGVLPIVISFVLFAAGFVIAGKLGDESAE